jgi:hypothetical protein
MTIAEAWLAIAFRDRHGGLTGFNELRREGDDVV